MTVVRRRQGAGAEPGVFQGEPLKLEIGDAEAALAAAPHKVDATYRTPRHNHNADRAARGDGGVGRRRAASSTTRRSASRTTAWSLAQVFGIDEEQVHVTSPYVGGGFGGKTLWQHQILAAAAAKLAGRPVRIVLSREGVYRVVGGRTLTEQRVAIGAQADGRFDALIHTGVGGDDARTTTCPSRSSCRRDRPMPPAASSSTSRRSHMDMLANTFMRAPGESVGTFALECAIDELADRARHRPDRAAHPQRAGEGPDHGHALLLAPHRRGLARGRRALRLERAQRRRRARAARANGWSAWAARPRPIPTTACPAARRASR